MIMSLSPYSNSPVTACFVSVTSTAQGLSKSTFQKMKRECSPDDKPNFSIDKRQRFFIRFCQCCVAFIPSNVPAFFLSLLLFPPLMYINLDLSVVRTKVMMKYVLSLRKPSPSGSPQKSGGKEGWARKNGRPPCYSQPKGFLRVELRFCTLHKPKSSVLQKISTGSGCLQLCAHGPFYQWHEEAVTVSLY